MKMLKQWAAAVKRAASILGITGKGKENNSASSIILLYKSVAQLHLKILSYQGTLMTAPCEHAILAQVWGTFAL